MGLGGNGSLNGGGGRAYHGRLELTWTNKDQALLTREDGSYEWVARSDYRVAEVRLLGEVETVGEVKSPPPAAADNLLIHGDALNALHSVARLSDLSDKYVGKVRLAYLDPPFNTQQSFLQYDDALEHSVWLTMMRDRLAQIRDLLAPDGCIWVHCDDSEQAHLRVLMDELFGREQFVANVIWKRRNDPRNTAQHVSTDHDSIMVYGRDIETVRTNQLPRTEAMDKAYTNPDDDDRGPWRRGDLAARNYYSKGLYAVTTPSGRVIDGPPSGSYWRVSKEELERLDSENRIYWGADGASRPYLKRFLSEVKGGRVPSSVWPPEEVGFVRNGKEEVRSLVGDVFATPKPERLMQRIIQIATDPGDIVLDCFIGSGTTAAVAHKMGRRWIGIERSRENIDTYVLPRLRKVVSGQDAGGITTENGWQGGGGFRVMEVRPSMFEDVGGVVALAEWATNGALAQATAAQLGFSYLEEPPFSGLRGHQRLAVLDGMLNQSVLDMLIRLLGEEETLIACGTAVDPSALQHLRVRRPGSRVRKIPASLLAEYKQTSKSAPTPTAT